MTILMVICCGRRNIEEMADVSEEYESSWIANVLHQFPHFDLGFRRVNATFDLHDRTYLEVDFVVLMKLSNLIL